MVSPPKVRMGISSGLPASRPEKEENRHPCPTGRSPLLYGGPRPRSWASLGTTPLSPDHWRRRLVFRLPRLHGMSQVVSNKYLPRWACPVVGTWWPAIGHAIRGIAAASFLLPNAYAAMHSTAPPVSQLRRPPCFPIDSACTAACVRMRFPSLTCFPS